MRIGVVFPQTEIGADPTAVRDCEQAVETLGYRHLRIYDHVLGASTANRPDWRAPIPARRCSTSRWGYTTMSPPLPRSSSS